MLDHLSNVELAFLVAAVPTASMGLASALMSTVQVSPLVESVLQFFAGGLIVAAVAAELFPLMLEGVSAADSMIGVTVGFAVGIALVYGSESLMEQFEKSEEKPEDPVSRARNSSLSLIASFGGKGEHTHDHDHDHDHDHAHSHSHGEAGGYTHIVPRAITSLIPADDVETAKELEEYKNIGSPEIPGEWNEEDIRVAQLAILNPEHRSHVAEHLREILDKINIMSEQSAQLINSSNGGTVPDDTAASSSGSGRMTVKEQELLAEKIDEGVHQLQYLLDHTRRLVEGAESEITGFRPKVWLTDDRKRTMRRRIAALKYSAEHLVEHIDSKEEGVPACELDTEVLKEVHAHMGDMDKQISYFHDSVQKAASRWGRKAYTLPDPELGDTIPMGLVVPVTIDCLVDGFLIGVTVALSPKAGIILGAANCLEMGSLGLAYSMRLYKCTGTRPFIRYLALYLPCACMFLASGLGAVLASASQSVPAVFVGFVAFGTVALLTLAINELFFEAQNQLGEEGPQWPSMCMLFAVWLVLIVDRSVAH